MLRLRILTALVGVPLIYAAVVLGPLTFGAFLAFVSVSCTFELCRLVPGLQHRDPLALLAIGWSAILSLRSLVSQPELSVALISVPLVLSLLLLLTPRGRRRSFTEWAWTVGGALYVGWLMGHWGLLYMVEGGALLVVFGMFTTFGYDTGAYFAGRAFGRHKMAPYISPSKTWEGAAGGVALALGVGLIVRVVAGEIAGSFPLNLATTVIAALLIPIAAQLGDLVESALKRSAGAKDAGNSLPGHGGMLDRFDSLLFAGTMLYFYTLWIAL